MFDGERARRRRGPALGGRAARRPLRRAARLPGDRGAARALEKALKDRLPDKLAGTVWTDPRHQGDARRRARTARPSPRGWARARAAAAQVARLRERLEKKKRDLEARQRDLEGRRTEKWVALGSAVLSNVGLFTGRKRTISGAGTVVSKNRMEDTAEARVEALKAEIADLEQELAAHSSVDPAAAPVHDGGPDAHAGEAPALRDRLGLLAAPRGSNF